MVRFVHHINYAEGISRDDGDAWYLNEHAPKARDLPGVTAYLSYPQQDQGIPVGPGLPTPHDQFVRRSELQFDNIDTALNAINGNLDLWAPSAPGIPGFREVECMFLNEEFEFDLRKDVPFQQYKYMTLPMWWPKGPPVDDETKEHFIHSYSFGYKEEITLANAEDWYLGHHAREGKQLPGIRWYKTWKTIRVPEINGSPLHPNKYYRLTELGMNRDVYMENMMNEDTRVRFTQGPFGRVINNIMSIPIKHHIVDDLMA
jgi:hypothetical protein